MDKNRKGLYNNDQAALIIIGSLLTIIISLTNTIGKIDDLLNHPLIKPMLVKVVVEKETEKCKEEIKNIEKQYYSGKLGYEEAYDKLSDLHKNKFSNFQEIDDARNRVLRNEADKSSFAEGEYYYKIGNYPRAYKEYSNVSGSYSEYGKAKTKMDECYKNALEPLFNEAKALYDKGEYIKAKDKINSVYECVDGNSLFMSLYNMCQNGIKDQEFEESVVEIFETNGFQEGFYFLSNYLYETSTNYSVAKKVYDTYVIKYKEFTIDEFNKLFEAGKYAEGIECLSKAVLIIGEDDELIKLYNNPTVYKNLIDIKKSRFDWLGGENVYPNTFYELEFMNRFYDTFGYINVACLHVDDEGKIYAYNIKSNVASAYAGYPNCISKTSFMHPHVELGISVEECKGIFILKSIEFESNKIMQVWENPQYEAWLKWHGVNYEK